MRPKHRTLKAAPSSPHRGARRLSDDAARDMHARLIRISVTTKSIRRLLFDGIEDERLEDALNDLQDMAYQARSAYSQGKIR